MALPDYWTCAPAAVHRCCAPGCRNAILVTLSRFTDPARKAANSATPTVDLISGDRLADLIRDDGASGVSLQPTVNESWFDKFD